MKHYYVIAVDYYCYNADTDEEYTESCFLYTTRDKLKLYVFDPSLNYLHHDLKWFATEKEAQDYIDAHNLSESCSYENCRVERIDYE